MLGHQTEITTQVVHRDGDVLAQKITALIKLARHRIDQRVVGNGIHLRFHDFMNTRDPFDDWPHVLGQASQRVTILDLDRFAVGKLASF